MPSTRPTSTASKITATDQGIRNSGVTKDRVPVNLKKIGTITVAGVSAAAGLAIGVFKDPIWAGVQSAYAAALTPLGIITIAATLGAGAAALYGLHQTLTAASSSKFNHQFKGVDQFISEIENKSNAIGADKLQVLHASKKDTIAYTKYKFLFMSFGKVTYGDLISRVEKAPNPDCSQIGRLNALKRELAKDMRHSQNFKAIKGGAAYIAAGAATGVAISGPGAPVGAIIGGTVGLCLALANKVWCDAALNRKVGQIETRLLQQALTPQAKNLANFDMAQRTLLSDLSRKGSNDLAKLVSNMMYLCNIKKAFMNGHSTIDSHNNLSSIQKSDLQTIENNLAASLTSHTDDLVKATKSKQLEKLLSEKVLQELEEDVNSSFDTSSQIAQSVSKLIADLNKKAADKGIVVSTPATPVDPSRETEQTEQIATSGAPNRSQAVTSSINHTIILPAEMPYPKILDELLQANTTGISGEKNRCWMRSMYALLVQTATQYPEIVKDHKSIFVPVSQPVGSHVDVIESELLLSESQIQQISIAEDKQTFLNILQGLDVLLPDERIVNLDGLNFENKDQLTATLSKHGLRTHTSPALFNSVYDQLESGTIEIKDGKLASTKSTPSPNEIEQVLFKVFDKQLQKIDSKQRFENSSSDGNGKIGDAGQLIPQDQSRDPETLRLFLNNLGVSFAVVQAAASRKIGQKQVSQGASFSIYAAPGTKAATALSDLLKRPENQWVEDILEERNKPKLYEQMDTLIKFTQQYQIPVLKLKDSHFEPVRRLA